MVKINEKYYMDADSRNYTLKETAIIKSKDGTETEGFKELGFYTNLECLCNGVIKTELRTYIKESENATIEDLLNKLKEIESFIKEKLGNI